MRGDFHRSPIRSPRFPRYPAVIAYDVVDDGRRGRLFRCLQRWRIEAQYSLFECRLGYREAEELFLQLAGLIDEREDYLALAWIDRNREARPITRGARIGFDSQYFDDLTLFFMALRQPPIPQGPSQKPKGPSWHVIAYDIREDKRLRQVHACIKKEAVAFQKSVFLLHKTEEDLERLLDAVRRRADDREDDIRLYPLRHPRDLWTAGLQAEMFQALYGGSSGKKRSHPKSRDKRNGRAPAHWKNRSPLKRRRQKGGRRFDS